MADPKTKIPKHMSHGEAVRRPNSLGASLGRRSASDMAEKSRFGPVPRGNRSFAESFECADDGRRNKRPRYNL